MTKTIFLTLSGRTNAGKSTLLNALIGERIASVSSKPQTTRTRITGIRTEGETQLVFVDTPGLHKPTTRLNEQMLRTAQNAATDSDAVLYVIDSAKPLHKQDEEMLESITKKKIPLILILNKIDLIPEKSKLMGLMLKLENNYHPHSIIPVSAEKNDGLDIILDTVTKMAQPSVHFFPDDSVTDQTERVLAEEMIREKLLWLLRDELPHGIAVSVESMKEREEKEILDISAIIICERANHKGMIIGKKGEMLKRVSIAARKDLERFFQIQVNLKCFVKIKEDWRNKEGLLRSLGLTEEV